MKISKSDKLDFNLDILEDLNFKFIENKMQFTLYKIIYAYKTMRGNKKENHRYLIAEDVNDAKMKFIEYINKFNRENKHRAVLNVKILNAVNIGTVTK